MAFTLSRGNKAMDKKLAKKATTTVKNTKTVAKGTDIISQINQIKAMTEKYLGKYKDDYLLITDKDILHEYISDCIGNGYISIDTETDGLDPLQNKLAGICPYTYGQKGAYIPLNHISYVTMLKSAGQLEMDFVVSEFKRLLEKKPEIDMFNAKFDIRFLRHNGLPDIYCTWDGYLAAKIMNENEPTHGLKPLYDKYVGGTGEVFSFGDLFKGIPFTMIPPQVGYLYAAGDPVKTTELCDYQRKYVYYDPEKPNEDRNGMNGASWVFENIEMPCIPVIADMEDNGISFDKQYAQQLSTKYNQLLQEKLDNFYELLNLYKEEIDKYRSSNTKLDNPVNIGSPTQIAILLYDVLKVESPDKKNARGTGEDILVKISNKKKGSTISKLCQSILDYREIAKLLSTYIDKLPNCVNPNDGRIHCSFNQYGAQTGRMSSSDPNLQNIPSRNHDIRKMFIATQEEKWVEESGSSFVVSLWDEVKTVDGWKYADNVCQGDRLQVMEENKLIEVIVDKIDKLIHRNEVIYYYK